MSLFRRKREAGPPPPPQPGGALVLPAGADLDKLVGERPTTRRRARLRRRLRHLRGVREVLLRDLGGMVFEVHRAGAHDSPVVGQKLARLAMVDAELRELESALDDRKGMVVREPGIGGTCTNCGELYGSEARFCWACGTPVVPGAQPPPSAVGAMPPPPSAPPTAVLAPGAHIEGTSEDLPPPPPPTPPPPT